jgi:sulfur-oxidizing protein SoxZ
MTEPTRIRATVRDGVAEVRLRVAHEMETGRRKEAGGALVPAWYITELTIALNGKPVVQAGWGPGVSRNPFLRFRIRGARVGDRLSVNWTDNRGATRADEVSVT